MDFGYMFLFLGISILSSVTSKNSAIGMIKRIGTNSWRYPKWYVIPAKWVRKLFKIKQHLIPRYLYFELILSLFFAFLGPINLVVCFAVDFAPKIVGVLVMINSGLVIFDTIFFGVMSYLLKKQQKLKDVPPQSPSL